MLLNAAGLNGEAGERTTTGPAPAPVIAATPAQVEAIVSRQVGGLREDLGKKFAAQSEDFQTLHESVRKIPESVRKTNMPPAATRASPDAYNNYDFSQGNDTPLRNEE